MNVVNFKFTYVFKHGILNKVICNQKRKLIYSSFIWLRAVELLLCAKHCSGTGAAALNQRVPFLRETMSPENSSIEFEMLLSWCPCGVKLKRINVLRRKGTEIAFPPHKI